MKLIESFRLCNRNIGFIEILKLSVIQRLRAKIFSESWGNLYVEAMQRFLNRYYKDILSNYRGTPLFHNSIEYKCPIWLFWWQGDENLPEVISQCRQSVYRNANGHPVVVLNKNNIADYVSIPQYIYKKFDSGLISFPHFSDILRLSLLYQKGGIWLDSAVFVLKPIDMKGCFFTVNPHKSQDCHMMGKWVISVLASGAKNNFIKFVLDCLLKYWKEKDEMIDYLYFDAVFHLAYENFKEVCDVIEALPNISPDFYDTRYFFPKKYNEQKLAEFIDRNTYLSMTYRVPYPKILDDGCLTNYGALLKILS